MQGSAAPCGCARHAAAVAAFHQRDSHACHWKLASISSTLCCLQAVEVASPPGTPHASAPLLAWPPAASGEEGPGLLQQATILHTAAAVPACSHRRNDATRLISLVALAEAHKLMQPPESAHVLTRHACLCTAGAASVSSMLSVSHVPWCPATCPTGASGSSRTACLPMLVPRVGSILHKGDSSLIRC